MELNMELCDAIRYFIGFASGKMGIHEKIKTRTKT
jgi:hypothetical protein